MTHIFIGCDRIAGHPKAFFNKLSSLELKSTFEASVDSKKLAQLRTNSRKGFAFSMLANRGVTHPVEALEQLPEPLRTHPVGDFGLLLDTPAVRASWEHTLAQAAQLSPKVILLQTPLEFAPGAESRRRLEWFSKELLPLAGKIRVAWQPHGLWDIEEAVGLARALNIVPVFDPLAEEQIPPGRGTAYFALYQRRGLRAKFDDFDMEDLLERCLPYQRAIIVFRGTDRYRDARLAYTVWEANRDIYS